MSDDGCPNGPVFAPRAHILQMVRRNGEREVWVCIKCGRTEIRGDADFCDVCQHYAPDGHAWGCIHRKRAP